MSIEISPAPSSLVTASEQDYAALERVRPLTLVMEASTLVNYVIDVPRAAAVMRATARRVAAIRARFTALPDFDASHVDRYEDLAGAMMANQALSNSISTVVVNLFNLGVALMRQRTSLFLACDTLADQGYLDAAVIAKLREGTGYSDLMQDIAALLAIFKNNREKIANKHPISDALLDAISVAARDFGIALVDREHRDEAVAQLQTERLCIAALAVESNRQIRRAVAYLELDRPGQPEFAPSLFNNGTKGSNTPVIVTPPSPSPPAPLPTPVAEPAKPRDSRDNPYDDTK